MGFAAARDAISSADLGFGDGRELEVDDSGESVLAFVVDRRSWLSTLHTVRRCLEGTGCWAFVLDRDYDPTYPIRRPEMPGQDGLSTVPSAMIRRAAEVDVDHVMDDVRRRWQWSEREKEDLSRVEEMLTYPVDHTDLSAAEVVAAVTKQLRYYAPDDISVERWLFDRELQDGPLEPEVPGYLNLSFDLRQGRGEDHEIVVLPASEPWAVGAYIDQFGWGSYSTDIHTAVLRRWYQRYGATVAAADGLSLYLEVERPPSTAEEAWNVAYEMAIFWSDTAAASPGIRRHAYDLVNLRRWYVISRP